MSRIFFLTLALAALLLGPVSVQASQYSFINLDANGQNYGTNPLSLNDNGEVVGYVQTTTGGVPFSYQSGLYSVNYPVPSNDSYITEFTRLNNTGTIVGVDYYYYSIGHRIQGFRYSNQTYSPTNVYVWDNGIPPQPYGPLTTYVMGLNEADDMVGFYVNRTGAYQSFLTSSPGNLLNPYESDPPRVPPTPEGFVNYTPISVSGFRDTKAMDINDSGQIVGMVYDPYSVGFVKTGDVVQLVDFGGNFNSLSQTQLNAINDSGQAVAQVGSYAAFVYDIQTGSFSPIELLNLPENTRGIWVNDINDQGQIVGYYVDRSYNLHGFLATPVPLPGAIWLLGTGLLGLGAVGWRRRRPGG